MKCGFLCACLLILVFTVNGLSQNKPAWLVALEKTISQKEKVWKIDNKIERYNEFGFEYNLTLKSKGNVLSLQIARLNDVPNAEETFNGQVIAFGNTVGKKMAKIKLQNFGDQSVLWRDNGAVFLDFRRRDIFAHIFTSSEIIAKRFARYILEQIPEN